ncbi:hypothetical protein E1267_28830 [Nonomuraea longispora]|uniref:Tyr recombinase domain-containing protein n=1 Tax=Nonomuraea longispora TaxID=1848320 RepID=A0A4R4N640_9ACTN|nr:hypothetical protein E1267_28830 [Nonomuraea longispora]
MASVCRDQAVRRYRTQFVRTPRTVCAGRRYTLCPSAVGLSRSRPRRSGLVRYALKLYRNSPLRTENFSQRKTSGRPSKALTLAQALAVLAQAEKSGERMRAYIVLSLLIGARTKELRALLWSHVVAYDQSRAAWLPVAQAGWEHSDFAVYVWRSVRQKGDTKTVKSRRSLRRCVDALRLLKDAQDVAREKAGDRWQDTDLVFCTRTGTPVTAHNVRRDFRKVVEAAGLTGREWSPRELRHSFVSVLSDSGVPVEDISRLVGHSNTVVTETVY